MWQPFCSPSETYALASQTLTGITYHISILFGVTPLREAGLRARTAIPVPHACDSDIRR
jgi:hypothetical protein